MDRASLDRLARFFGRERLGHLYLKAWRFLVDGMSRRLALPDYVGERILDHALSELDSRLDEFRLAIDARPSVWLFALGWSHAEEILKGRTGDTADAGPDADFWGAVRHAQLGDDGLATSRALVTALGELDDERHQILLCLDAVARGPANRQIASEATGEGLLVVDELRREARDALRRAFAIHAPSGIDRPRRSRSDDADTDEHDPLAEALRASLVDEDVFPPLGDIESLYGWLDRHFERSRAEIALAALWKRLPPPEKVEVDEKMAPGPMVALAESLYERIEKLETGIAERLDALDERRDEPATHAEPRADGAPDAGARLLRRGSGDDRGPTRRPQPQTEPEAYGAHGRAHDPRTHSSSALEGVVPEAGDLDGRVRDARYAEPRSVEARRDPVAKDDDDGIVADPASRHAPSDADHHAIANGTDEHDATDEEILDARVASARTRAGWRTDRATATDAAANGAGNPHDATATNDPGTAHPATNGHAASEADSSTNGDAPSRRSRFTGFWKAIRPAPRERTHEEVVQRLEKYLPAGKKVRPAPPGSRLEDDPARPNLASPSDAAAPGDDARADAGA